MASHPDRDMELADAAPAIVRELHAAQQRIAQLEEALATRRDIGIAIGIIMVQGHVDQDRAFRILSAASQRTNTKLRDLAGQLVKAEDERAAGHPAV